MPEPTLTQVFGANATQSAANITIAKSDLATVETWEPIALLITRKR